ncbi:MAG TPA: murein L,D-transpeptidase catalytic domain family protein [Niabella sp.]|nr:murein L,D-transpeptidase catalytic domain family protein [Niabella sp.]HOZ97293.1 murein L,D-transpeptidase catalytic domain family protein [Niabella sp.]HQW15436.1 murein L,D-transpeptidase catalytic domain family protein [Niabella sp.]HQX20518.1 murein L,D-transpeptidase catalytic domain family protein [Niabella sp.]HQX41729.1 murein L,D-transpeptidase catalytic domain family protein [Niabella sp.]
MAILCGCSLVFLSWKINNDISKETKVENIPVESKINSNTIHPSNTAADARLMVYDSLKLDIKGLSHEAFEYAIDGFEKLIEDNVLENDSVLTIIDFDQPSYQKRLYVIDVKNYKMLFNTLVAHGKNTGKELAESFSNVTESNKSSLGFYITDVTYQGSKGFSLKLRGIESRLNSNAMRRAIVMHGAEYVSQSYINAQGYIGRSHGCPAVPVALTRPLIQTIKNGSCLFIYNKAYKPSNQFLIG